MAPNYTDFSKPGKVRQSILVNSVKLGTNRKNCGEVLEKVDARLEGSF